MPATIGFIANGGTTTLPPAAPPPALPPAPPPPPLSSPPPPPALAPVSASPQYDPALLAAAGVTAEQVAAADAAAAVAAASAGALLAGEGSAGMAAAAADAGGSQEVIQALLDLGIPDITNLQVGGDNGSGGSVDGTDDLAEAEAEAEANAPDLSDLPDWELVDPFGLQFEAATNPPLRGGGALTAIVQAAVDAGIDPFAVVADSLHEGANGGIGDGGHAYGPFQDHLTDFRERPFYGRGINNPTVNAWAWSDNGIRYSIRQMANGNPSAKGLRGHAAVYAIVYGYERPQDKAGAYRTRAAEYDKLMAMGSGWAAYAAPLFKGPAAGGAVDTKPITSGGETVYHPAGVTANWRDLVDVFKITVPKGRDRVKSLADSLVEVFK